MIRYIKKHKEIHIFMEWVRRNVLGKEIEEEYKYKNYEASELMWNKVNSNEVNI